MRILAAHLYNDFSGSPKVLRQLVKGWISAKIPCTVYTGSKRDGFLSNINGAEYSYFGYKWSSNFIMRFVYFLRSQLNLFAQIWRSAHTNDIIYINTILPFGAALAGKLRGCRVIYHIHETSVRPRILRSLLFKVVEQVASDSIFVSKYLAGEVHLKGPKTKVLYNTLSKDYLDAVLNMVVPKTSLRNVLMVCSLKSYKGVREFIQLSEQLPYLEFRLVLNAKEEEINSFFDMKLPDNLRIYPTQTDVHPFYVWSDIVLNLSHPDRWVETFGLTILEGMVYGNPAIVPNVGGITELVTDGKDGYQIPVHRLNLISNTLHDLFHNPTEYKRLSLEAFKKGWSFADDGFVRKNIKILTT
ncbi:MAG: glycosyltransferase family 4 protein [Bacteroidia bacterium]|nr:glycosyltransferase family 4 protein [Bacteroidia bacterium]